MRSARDFLTFQAGWWAAFAWYQHTYWAFAVCAMFGVIAGAIDVRVERRMSVQAAAGVDAWLREREDR